MPTSKVSKAKKKFEVTIWFLPDENGKTYELTQARLKVKAEYKAKALRLGVDWIGGRWSDYDIAVVEK